MAKEPRPAAELSIWEDAQQMIEKARRDGVETVWDRFEQQTPSCKFCELGLTCKNCNMGPCRISFKEDGKMKRGVCGADGDVIVARNFGRFVAGGSAGHSDHGRDLIEVLEAIVEGEAPDYSIADEAKLLRVSAERGIAVEKREVMDVARDLVESCFSDFGSRRKELGFIGRVPEVRKEIWRKLKVMPRGVDREIAEMMHRTHMGCDNDAISTMLHSARTALADGWGGSMIGTELSDIIFGVPKPVKSTVSLGVLKEKEVNILVHGHNPVVSEMVLAAAGSPEMLELARQAGAEGINIGGLCCTGNELLGRQGIPMAGNHLMTELAIVTGAVEAVVVDYQCIMPSMVQAAACYHTKFITTADKARFTGATHISFNPATAGAQAREIVEMAIEAYGRRDQSRVEIPGKPVDIVAGFSNEALLEMLGGSLEPLLDAIKDGSIRGVVAIVGCNNPKFQHDSQNVGLAKELLKRDILVLVTGCVTTAAGKAGLLVPEGIELAGPGLKKICSALNIPPVLHFGSCVDNSRVIQLCGLIADALGVDICDLPVWGASPEWYSEKAVAIGVYCVASGIPVQLGTPPQITGSKLVTDLALTGLEDVFGASFMVEPDFMKAVEIMDARISQKRLALGLSA
ncbi:anaerobic carbon-monoxide dehydrogenase catalytic subunit [Desulforhopalus sp. IMCC35007]|uniref:anaerobic carbon-monoxide dehydrogenase catalytic subunit n=1 Tax=Desulforhopalus sp. IMCC35007 TaxID=2569543 RepID=UPI0010AE66DD|nr:anaerobic carbon-monoxide dehydrogenase catalytic subunit [Desulforhopalus sp. IMCC35007]TKB08139.1 anaerobic carbon-monoxide dehydrogenase catalytic subunit [Desulforhopalus sp. IMCC35007]